MKYKTDEEKEYLESLLRQGTLEDRGKDYIIRKPFAVEHPLVLDKTLIVPSYWTMDTGKPIKFYPTKDEDHWVLLLVSPVKSNYVITWKINTSWLYIIHGIFNKNNLSTGRDKVSEVWLWRISNCDQSVLCWLSKMRQTSIC